MTFIRDLARSRILTRQAEQVDAPRGEPTLSVGRLPDVASGGRPAPTKKSPGLSGALMRQSVADLYASGERLGLSLMMLSRHIGSFASLKADLDAFSAALEKPAMLRRPTDRLLFEQLPARLLSALGPGLAALDPTSAAGAIREVMKQAQIMIEAGNAPSREQIRGMERVAQTAGELGSSEMGEDLAWAMALFAKVGDPTVLRAATEATLGAAGALDQAAGSKSANLRLVITTALGAASGKDPAEEAKKAAGREKFSDGQLKIAADVGAKAQATKNQYDQKAAQAAQQIPAQQQAFLQNVEAKKGQGLEPEHERQLRGLADRAMGELSPETQLAWFQNVNANAAHGQGTFRAIAAGLLELYAGAHQMPAEVGAQVAQTLVQIGQRGVDPEALVALATEHLGWVKPVEAPATLALINNVLAALSEPARQRVLGMEGVELDGSSGLTSLANSFAGLTERYARRDGPLTTLQAAIENAQHEHALTQVLKNGARFAAAIPDIEHGGIVALLRDAFPGDLQSVTAAGQDLAVLAAAHPTLPADSLGRFISAAAGANKPVEAWLPELEAFFKNARGNKNHIRNLRTLMALAESVGVSAVNLVTALQGAKLSPQILCRTVEAILMDTGYTPPKEYLEKVIGSLAEGKSVLSDIEARQNLKLMKELNLDQLLQGAKGVKVTKAGLEEVQEGAANFFRTAAANAGEVPKELVTGLLRYTLEGRVQAFRYATPQAEKHLACLTPAQRQKWMEPVTMNHVRFTGAGKKAFDERISESAKLGELVYSRAVEAWGPLADLEAKHAGLVEQLRQIDKNNRAARRPIAAQMTGLPAKIETLRWAKKVAEMTPGNMTPEKFQRLANDIPTIKKRLGAHAEAALDQLVWTLRLSDIQYSEVTTTDNPSLTTMFNLIQKGGTCIAGSVGPLWAYIVDANKKYMVTAGAAGEQRRVIMRLVERQDAGHVGQPMLILERTYPDRTDSEERQRLIEHMVRRAADMGVACGFATEYYWDASKTGRAGIADMNKVIEDLCRRYGTVAEHKIMSATNRASNLKSEYLDSAPPNGAAGAGVVGVRTQNQQVDKVFENKFVVLTPER
ncbi:MAG: hypothetical protein IPG45_34280 [Deltaproteobacteria bacterium]|nr:hypothetical protein [Deltaproteobacteria bacterium]